MTHTRALVTAACLCAAASCSGSSSSGPPPRPAGLARLNHIVVIVLENWSFDSLYGEMAGAEGLAAAAGAPPQIDAAGVPYATLPQTETHLPATLPNAPFALDDLIPANALASTDLTNNFYEEQRQIHAGRMDQFVLFDAAAKGLTMGYYHTAGLPLAAEAATYTLCDHFFHGVFGGSTTNIPTTRA
jgi:phospholipase C